MSGPAELPAHVVVLRDFANTLDEETDVDALPNSADLVRWLHHYALVDGPDLPATPAHLDRALRLRFGLRRVMSLHHDGIRAPLPELNDLARHLPLRVDFSADTPLLTPLGTGVDAGLANLLVAVISAVADDSWPRLKLCRAADCRWAFYDASKNRSRTWCAMGVCGNRAKTRSYRARQKVTDHR